MDCIVGCDMSANIDLTSIVILIKYLDQEKKDIYGEPVTKYIVMQHSFIPNRDALRKRINTDKAPYDAWEDMGYLSVTNSPIVDQKYVYEWTKEFLRKYNLHPLCWAVDATNASEIMNTASRDKQTVYDVVQNHKSLNDATVGFREEVYSGNVVYTPDPLLNFAMGNAVTRASNGLIKVDKDANRQRIDPVDALICAFKLSKYYEATIVSQADFEKSIDNWLASDW